jgi:glycyl-tRNA synthetase
LDGLEITQFTYFQQSGGHSLDPISVEITYGLERIIMSLQDVTHFKDIRYAPGLSYGDVLGRNEYEMSVYNLEKADVDRMRLLFEEYEAEAIQLLEQDLAVPAYSYILKMSHTFNILDSRGYVGVTERAHFFARMRDQARAVATAWIGKTDEDEEPTTGKKKDKKKKDKAATTVSVASSDAGPQTFLFELGTEELPPSDLDSAIEQLQNAVPELLATSRIEHGEVAVAGTPRRVAVLVKDVSASQTSEIVEFRGPRFEAAFDADGNATGAAKGFAKSRGIDVSQLEKQEFPNGTYVVARVQQESRASADVLAESINELISGISFKRSMRWNCTDTFSRPVRWLVAMLGSTVLPCEYSGIQSTDQSRSLRDAADATFTVSKADDYLGLLQENGIVLSTDERRNSLLEQSIAYAEKVGGQIPAAVKGPLGDEVANLIESPTPLLGTFDESYLDIPREVLTTVMTKYQRYFPVENQSGSLMPYFITVANGRIDADAVRAGNEAVLRARFADARFFWKQDLKQPLADFRAQLEGLTFHERLGSMLLKSERLEKLAPGLTQQFNLSDADQATLTRAAHLAKADLVTGMVVEFTSLAGIMGREYALRSDESEPVATAIYEHVLPRFSGDSLPSSTAGTTLAIADRLDSLVGLFGVGLVPKSTTDPFGQRRAALGVVQLLRNCDTDVSLSELIESAQAAQSVELDPDTPEAVASFILRRFEQLLLEEGHRADLVRATLNARKDWISLASRTLTSLQEIVQTDEFQSVLTAYSRPSRLTRGKEVQTTIDPNLFDCDEEKELYQAFTNVKESVSEKMKIEDFVSRLSELVVPIDRFFESVFVMVDEEPVRQNRLALMWSIADLSAGVIDFTEIEGY